MSAYRMRALTKESRWCARMVIERKSLGVWWVPRLWVRSLLTNSLGSREGKTSASLQPSAPSVWMD